MWREIKTESELEQFMETMLYFHDSCVKEMCYLSGAYVTDKLAMYPINNRRILRVAIQQQYEKRPMIEMEFGGLKKLKLNPNDENHTCEILDATLIMKDGDVYWCDCGGLLETDLEKYEGTLICATSLRWRSVENFMGEGDFYHSGDE